MNSMPSELEFWRSEVKHFTTDRLHTEAKTMSFVKKNMNKFMPFPCPYLDAINEELKERYEVGNSV